MPSHRRAVWIVLAAILIDTIGFGVVMPVLPGLVTRLGHLDVEGAARMAGWMLVVFAVGQFVAGPVLGALGDRFGRRPVLVLAMAAFAIDYGLMAWAPSLGWLFLGRAIAGISGALVGPAGAVIADVSPAEERSAAFGKLGAAFGVGFIVGPAVGGLVAGLGERAPFAVAALLAATNAIAMLALLPETLAPENRRAFRWREATVVGAFKPLSGTGIAVPILIAWFLWQLGAVAYPATWAFWATIVLGWNARAIGASLAFIGVMTVLVQTLVVKRAVARLGERRAALLGLAVGMATLLAYAFVDRAWLVYAVYVPGALGGLAYPAMNGILSRLVDARHQGSLQGGLGSLNSVAAIVGPVLATQSLAAGAAHGFAGAAFLVGAVLVGTALAIVSVSLPRQPIERSESAEA
ncbi:MFS transporter [Sphingomonas sp.]|uniref:MFS transporter n=1 Tax=Sphingomonas sp. TaxID=28214 RepID=UPI003AFFDCC8